MAVDMDKLNGFIGQFVGDLGAAVHAGMVVIGERLGLYKALAAQPMTSAELAAKTNTDERYVREWLASQAAGGYVTYDKQNEQLRPERGTGLYSRHRRQPCLSPGSLPARRGVAGGSSADRRLFSHRRRYGLARTR